jgi:hypothetical protein
MIGSLLAPQLVSFCAAITSMIFYRRAALIGLPAR